MAMDPRIVEAMMASRLMRDEAEVEQFCTSLIALRELPALSRDDVAQLLLVFDGATENFYDMRGLMHTLEQRASAADYVDAVVDRLPQLSENDTETAEDILCRIANSAPYRELLLHHLTTAPPDGRYLVQRSLLAIVQDDDSPSGGVIETLRQLNLPPAA